MISVAASAARSPWRFAPLRAPWKKVGMMLAWLPRRVRPFVGLGDGLATLCAVLAPPSRAGLAPAPGAGEAKKIAAPAH